MRREYRIFLVCLLIFPLAFPEIRGQEGNIPRIRWKARELTELPVSVDNSRQKYFPPVISQLGGSCAQAANIGYLFTYEMNRLLDRDASLPENRFSYLFSWNFINDGRDQGSFGPDGLNLGMVAGMMAESDFPRQTTAWQFYWASGYDKYFRALHYRVASFNDIEVMDQKGIQQVRQYLFNRGEPGSPGGIVTFSAQANGWQFDEEYSGPSETGYTCLLTRLATDGAHAMTITGYDDLVEFTAPDGSLQKGAFIVTNTHGSFTHDGGKFYLPYWFFLQKRSQSILSRTVTGATVAYRKPELVFKVGLEYSSRDDLSFRIGVSGRPTDLHPLHDYVAPLANNQGGDYPMQGNNAPVQMEFAFDFSSYLDRVDEMAEPDFFLTVIKSDRGLQYGKGRMQSFEVYDYRGDGQHPKIYRTDVKGIVLKKGENIFNIPTTQVPETSFSPVEWLNASGQPVAAPLVFRTADGKYVKVRFSGYDLEKGTLKMKYVYAPDGSRKLK